MKDVSIKVVSGKCNQGFHNIGDTYTVGNVTPAGICTSAFASIFPLILTLQCGGEFFWEKNKRVTCASCPDDTGVIFEIKYPDE